MLYPNAGFRPVCRRNKSLIAFRPIYDLHHPSLCLVSRSYHSQEKVKSHFIVHYPCFLIFTHSGRYQIYDQGWCS